MARFFPPWKVTWDVWQAALRPDILGHCGGRTAVPCGRMSFGTQVPGVQGPVSSPGAQGGGGGGVIPHLLSFVASAMAIAQLTQLHISIPASGVPPGQVPAECFPGGTSLQGPTSPHRVLFASNVMVLGDAQPPVHSPDIVIHEPLRPEVIEEDVMDTGGVGTDTSAPIIPPPPGFRQFSWPHEDWKVGGDPSLFTFAEELPGWFPWSSAGLPVDLPSLPLSPITPNSVDDSVTAHMGSSREESNTPSEVVVVVPPIWDVLPDVTDVTDAEVLADSPLPTAEGLFCGFAVGTSRFSPAGRDRTWGSTLSKQGSSMAAGSGGPIPVRTVVVYT